MGMRRSYSRPEATGGPGPESPALRRVVEAMIAGEPVSPKDREALTDAERADVASLVRTTHLTRTVLQNESPNPAAVQESLDRAQMDLKNRATTQIAPAIVEPSPTGLRAWLDRLLRRKGNGT